MKRLILTIAAIASVAGPMAVVATDAAAQGRDRWDRRDDRWDRRYDRRADRWDRRVDRWDNRRYNGYYYNNRWSYGPPPSAYWGRPGFLPGYQAWRRGGHLPRLKLQFLGDFENVLFDHEPRGFRKGRNHRRTLFGVNGRK